MQSARLKFEELSRKPQNNLINGGQQNGDSAADKLGRSKSMRAAIQLEKCAACGKTVYAMERLEMNGRVYHKACFRCSVCKCVLTPKNFSINDGVLFCTTHYKQMFKVKGNYDEGFGRQQHKHTKVWGGSGGSNGDASSGNSNAVNGGDAGGEVATAAS